MINICNNKECVNYDEMQESKCKIFNYSCPNGYNIKNNKTEVKS